MHLILAVAVAFTATFSLALEPVPVPRPSPSPLTAPSPTAPAPSPAPSSAPISTLIKGESILDTAKRELGEPASFGTTGKDNPRLLFYARTTGLAAIQHDNSSGMPFAFVAFILSEAGYKMPNFNSLSKETFLSSFEVVDSPEPGDVYFIASIDTGALGIGFYSEDFIDWSGDKCFEVITLTPVGVVKSAFDSPPEGMKWFRPVKEPGI